MTLRRPSSSLLHASATTLGTCREIDDFSEEVAWLVRQHDRFARGWSRRGAGREASGPRGDRTRPFAIGTDALGLAGHCLETWQGGGQVAPCPKRVRDGILLLPSAIIRGPEDVSRCIERLLGTDDALPPGMARDAATLLAETAHNVCEHSGSIGAVAATWTAKGEDAGLQLAVIDSGSGLFARAATCSQEKGQARRPSNPVAFGPLDALLAPVAEMAERGMGLRLSRALIARYRGALHIRSGGRVVTLGAEPHAIVSDSPRRFAALPGTQICVRLRP